MRRIAFVGRDEIGSSLDELTVIELVRQGLIDFTEGRTIAPLPGTLLSHDPHGDCHIKFASSVENGLIAVKVATGYYDNPSLGLPVNDGLINVLSALTGEVICVMDDGGQLTGMRTAAMGVLAARLGYDDRSRTVGIIGTGYQAELQAGWAARHVTDRPVQLFGRSSFRCGELASRLAAQGVDAVVHHDVASLAASADILLICTSSSAPIVSACHLSPGHHVVSLGADGPGKMELTDDAYRVAAALAVDDLDQARRRSDFASAARQDLITPECPQLMGKLLADGGSMRRSPSDISLVNLCGSAACDLALISHLVSSNRARDIL